MSRKARRTPLAAAAVAGAVAVLAATIGGCNSAKPKDSGKSSPSRAEWQWTKPGPATSVSREQRIAVDVQPTLVKRGRTPLVYLVESGDPLGIVIADLTADRRLGSGTAPGRSIIRVESVKGAFIGDQNIAPGPLDASHEFGIFVEAGQPGSIRNETVGPAREIDR